MHVAERPRHRKDLWGNPSLVRETERERKFPLLLMVLLFCISKQRGDFNTHLKKKISSQEVQENRPMFDILQHIIDASAWFKDPIHFLCMGNAVSYH